MGAVLGVVEPPAPATERPARRPWALPWTAPRQRAAPVQVHDRLLRDTVADFAQVRICRVALRARGAGIDLGYGPVPVPRLLGSTPGPSPSPGQRTSTQSAAEVAAPVVDVPPKLQRQ